MGEGEPDMSEVNIDEIEKTKGASGLRKQLEETLAVNKQLTGELTQIKAKQVIETGGYSTVTVEDLEGVSLEEVEAKAEALHQERENLVKNYLTEHGLDPDALDETVAALLSSNDSSEEEAPAFGRTSEMKGLQGSPLQAVSPQALENLSPRQELEMSFEQDKKKKSLKV